MLTDNELLEELKILRDKALSSYCISKKRRLAASKIMDAVDCLHAVKSKRVKHWSGAELLSLFGDKLNQAARERLEANCPKAVASWNDAIHARDGDSFEIRASCTNTGNPYLVTIEEVYCD